MLRVSRTNERMDDLTNKKMAAFIGISPTYLSDVKCKRKTLGKSTAKRVSTILGVPFDEIAFANGEDFIEKIQRAMIFAELKKGKPK